MASHPNAYHAARLAECGAEQGHFQAVHDVLYQAVTLSGLNPGSFAAAAAIPDSIAFAACAERLELVARIEEDDRIAEALDINSVPGIIVNGTLLGTPPDSATLLELVRREIEKAR